MEELPLEQQIEINSNLQTSYMPQWFWQSDPDPWKIKDPSKWTWTPYNLEICCRIEKAFILSHKFIDIDQYQLDLQKMVQVLKKDRNKVRRIKREAAEQSRSRFLLELPKPLTIEKAQKTISHAFGNVHHFLGYITKRTAQAYNLFQKLKRLDLNQGMNAKQDQYKDIIEEVISCIRQGAETRAKIIKIRTQSEEQANFTFEAQCIIEELGANSDTLKNFLQAILRVYTLESFMCYWLNELLRSEDWEELNVLTPYLVCLAYIFKHQNYVMSYDSSRNVKTFFGLFSTKTLLLYRGTALTPDQLTHYNTQEVTHFSWNAVTSTSLCHSQASEFISRSLHRAKEQKEDKIGAMFIVEVDFASPEDSEGMIDVSQTSKFPREKEVILAPGSVFKLLSVQRSENGVFDIKLKLTRKFGEKKKGNNVVLLGALHDKIVVGNSIQFNGLSQDDIIKAVELLGSNQLVTRMEIRNCTLQLHVTKLIGRMWRTTNIKPEQIMLKNNTIHIDRFSSFSYHFLVNDLDALCRQNKIIFEDSEVQTPDSVEQEWKIEEFRLGNEALQKFYEYKQLAQLWHKLTKEDNLSRLILIFSELSIIRESFDDLLVTISFMRKLRYLSLDFGSYASLDDEGLIGFSDTIKDHSALDHLSLNLVGCAKISDKGLSRFARDIQMLTSLTHLALDFAQCNKISDESIVALGACIRKLTSLHSLSFNFADCVKISDTGIDSLAGGIVLLTSLNYVSLSFAECAKITNKGIAQLANSIGVMKFLQSLSLDFSGCTEVSDESLSRLIDSISALSSLHHLSVNFARCTRISDEGLNKLSEGIIMLTSLHYLSMQFAKCDKISEEGANKLSESFRMLTFLDYLSLNFGGCFVPSSKSMSKLTYDIRLLTSLQHLSLSIQSSDDQSITRFAESIKLLTLLHHFSFELAECIDISEKAVSTLLDSFKTLMVLNHLHLSFKTGSNISNEAFSKLTNSIRTLTSLNYLSLNFENSFISDESMCKLTKSITDLISLRHVSLNLSRCKEISDKGIMRFAQGLKTLVLLNHLSLDFHGCVAISSDGVSKLLEDIRVFTLLRHLSLDLSRCMRIYDEDLTNLANSLRASLYHLSLNFAGCKDVSDRGVIRLVHSIETLTSLQFLSLNFADDSEKESNENAYKFAEDDNSYTAVCFKKFAGFSGISDKALGPLATSIRALTSLQHLSLNLESRNSITDVGLTKLADSIERLASLHNLFLNFDDCSKITKEGVGKLKNVIKELISLRHLSLQIYEKADE